MTETEILPLRLYLELGEAANAPPRDIVVVAMTREQMATIEYICARALGGHGERGGEWDPRDEADAVEIHLAFQRACMESGAWAAMAAS